jgi:hypothetical protein
MVSTTGHRGKAASGWFEMATGDVNAPRGHRSQLPPETKKVQ